MKKKKSWFLTFLICVLAVPTCGSLLGELILPADWLTNEAAHALLKPWLGVGTLLGIAHLFIRPILRALSAPLGCLTLGLFGFAIDVGLIYGCAYLVPGFEISGPLYAILTAIVINTICAIAGSNSR